MKIIFVLPILLVAVASSSLEYGEEWDLWKAQHGKWYQSLGEERERHRVWLTNREYIEQHNANADYHGYTLALNHFGDLVQYNCCNCHVLVYVVLTISCMKYATLCPASGLFSNIIIIS